MRIQYILWYLIIHNNHHHYCHEWMNVIIIVILWLLIEMFSWLNVFVVHVNYFYFVFIFFQIKFFVPRTLMWYKVWNFQNILMCGGLCRLQYYEKPLIFDSVVKNSSNFGKLPRKMDISLSLPLVKVSDPDMVL